MTPVNNRNRDCKREAGVPEKARMPTLRLVLDILHTEYGFPIAMQEPYIRKLKSLLGSDPKRINKAIHSLSTAARSPGPSRQRKGYVQRLVAKFDEILENELSRLADMQDDRDLSILPLIGMKPIGRGDREQEVEEEEEERVYDGRFDDPLTEFSSPTASTGRESPKARSKLDIPISRILSYSPRGKNNLDTDHEAHTDSDDSDGSFYSCYGTPSRPELTQRNAELENGHLLPESSPSRDTVHAIQRPRRVPYRANLDQQISHLRPSVLTNNGKRPILSPKSGTGTQREFHSVNLRRRESFDTNTTHSAESSFNALSSFSGRFDKGWSPLTSADTSFSHIEDLESKNHSPGQKGPVAARLAIVAEGIDETNSFGEIEAPYNGDYDEETTDVDDIETNCCHKQQTTPIHKSKKLSNTLPVPSSKNRSLPRNSKKKPSAAPNPASREAEQSQTERKTVEEQEKEKAEEFHELAKTFFGGELKSSSDLPPPLTPSDDDIDYVDQQITDLDEGEEIQRSEVSRGIEEDDLIDNQDSSHGAMGEVQVPWDDEDEDEFGTIDANFEHEFSNNPALKPTAHPLPTLHFAIQHEATRVALNKGFHSSESICYHLCGHCDDLYQAKEYRDVWKTLTEFSEAAKTLEWTNESIWKSFQDDRGWPDNISLTGRVHYGEAPLAQGSTTKGAQFSTQGKHSKKTPFVVTLNPLSRTIGNRFFNRFGSDRFLTLRLPPLSSQSGLSKDLVQQERERIINWLADEEIDLMNRKWKCFFVKDGSSKRKSDESKTVVTDYFSQAMFFATEGVGIGDKLTTQEMEALGFKMSEKKLRQEMSVETFLKWHIPLKGNLNMTVPKFWSRISLGLSNAIPTITFEPSQIEFVRDVESHIEEVMNDGCSIASPAVMKIVRQKLGLEVTPTAVQARLGGAKGVWMVDPSIDWNSEEIYIKVTTSQLKYQGYENDDDWARLTLDVLTASHDPLPAKINIQLIPILEDRGVPFEALRELLEEHLDRDLEELFQIMDKPAELRRWIYDRGKVGNERMSGKNVATLGAMPASRHEIAIMLLEGGFSVNECNFLMEQVRKFIDQHCDDLKSKLHIKIPYSTTLLCVADPTGTLREGEVSLRFSKGVLDPKTMRRNPVIIGDILVARNPAQIPSDIQKVRAVDLQPYHSPGLRELQDVIVFSIQGDRSLASLLSGGDYDGDKPWVCWDQRLVEPFRNSPATFVEFEKQARSYFEKSETTMVDLLPDQPNFFNRFFRAGISNSLQDNFLGHCTSVWEKYCYSQNRISDPTAIELAKLCSFLVDAPKQGLSILASKREEITRLGNRYPKPAYKEPGSQGQSKHVIDRLQFDVAGEKVMEKQKAFHDSFGSSPSYEPLITEIYRREQGLVDKQGPGEPLAIVLKDLNRQLEKLLGDWRDWAGGSKSSADDFKSGVPRFYRRFREIKPPEEHSEDPVISRWVSEGDSHFSHWNILRASAAYYKWKGQRSLVWYMAGRELCFIKSHGAVMAGSDFGPRSVIEEMYIPLKTSGKFRSVRKATAMETREDKA